MNARLRFVVYVILVGGGLTLAFTGCPKPSNATLALIVSPKSLDFGTTQTSLTLNVSKNFTSTPLGVFRVTSNVTWLTADPATGNSSGPDDPATITVSVDRALMSVGTNLASISVTAEGASRIEIPVQAVRQVAAAFAVSNNAAFTGDELQFTDLSQTVSEAPSIISWEWDFGDGSTSSEQNPIHAYTAAGSYDISLTVSNGDETATLSRRDYVSVQAKVPPSANFSAEPTNAVVGEAIQFTNLSEIGTSPITSYSWSFGDGSSSTEENPLHTYAEVGTYAITLTVESEHGRDSTTKQNYVTISPIAPVAAFFAEPREVALGPSGARVQFTDHSQQGTYDITEWFWEFGDGGTSEEQDPSHVYTRPGLYTVSLTVTAQNGQTDTETVVDYINVVETTLTADFSADTQVAWVGQSIQFTDTSLASPTPVTAWSWNFGDGGTSQEANPTHAYSEEGTYTVSLTVSNAYGTDTEVKADYITVSPLSVLERYIIESGPPSYAPAYPPVPIEYEGQTVTFHVLDLKSQTFRAGDVEPAEWQHWLVLVTPPVITTDTALMIISGGRNSDTPRFDPNDLSAEAGIAAGFAAQMGAVAVLLPTVPNQPLDFGDGVGRTEDNAIAYTYDKFFQTGDEYWPLLLPMTKSAVSAMDVTQAYGAELGLDIASFVVTGGSKRGWTTWLTGVADDRVKAIAPLVIDVLDMQTQMNYHKQAYNGYSEAVQDYVEFNIFDRFDTERGQELLEIVDPYSYLPMLTMPKFIINSTGDQFFLPDSAQFYVHELPGETRLRYLPNTDHGIEQGDSLQDLAASLFSFFAEVANDAPLPSFSWEVTAHNEIQVATEPEFPPVSVTLWTATVSGEFRDFRFATVGAVWESEALADPDNDGVYVANVPTPTEADTWTGFFVDLTFDHAGVPHTFSTELRVTPDTMPFGPDVLRVDKNATGANDGSSWSNAFTSIQAAITAAQADGVSEIWVAEGTYNEAITLESDLALYGGFEGTEYARFDRDVDAHPTIINGSTAAAGQAAKHVVYMHQTTNARIDGFSITGGDASGVVPDDWPATAGGGIYCGRVDETNVIANCSVYGNSADDSGGGIACVGYRGDSNVDECNPTIENCIITDNYGDLGAGGMVCIVAASPSITNTIIAGNSCQGVPNEAGGAGVGCADASSPTFANCLIASNTTPNQAGGAGIGSPIWGGDCDPVFVNTIFYGNDDVAVHEGTEDSDATLRNCLFYNNEAGDVFDETANLYTGAAQINANIPEASNCISGDPLFADAENGDYRVSPDSPAIDSGTSDGAPSADIEGTARPQGAADDIGPYEQ